MRLFDKIHRQVEEFERQFAHADIEHGAAWDAGGNLVFRREGIFGAVPIYPQEEARLENGLFTHVHHNGSSFSDGDLMLAARIDLAEMRVAGIQNGRMVVYVVRRSGEIWPIAPEQFAGRWQDLALTVKNPSRPALDEAYQQGDYSSVDRIMRYDSVQAITHEIMKTLESQIGGFLYERVFP